MGRMRTLLTTAALACAGSTAAFGGQGLLYDFASCAGRLSAQMEHEWLWSLPASVQTERHRNEMVELVQAMMEPGEAVDVLDVQIGAKVAHARLLQRASFNESRDDAAWAEEKARWDIAQCRGFLLASS